jgi:hypothetical protein
MSTKGEGGRGERGVGVYLQAKALAIIVLIFRTESVEFPHHLALHLLPHCEAKSDEGRKRETNPDVWKN